MKNLLSLFLCSMICAVSSLAAQSITQYTENKVEDLGILYAEHLSYLDAAMEALEKENADMNFDGLVFIDNGRQMEAIAVAQGSMGSVVRYRITFKSRHRVRIGERLDEGLSSEEALLWSIKQGALAHIENPCPGKYGVLVAPDPDGSGYLALCYREQEDNDIIPIGGYYRMMYSSSGVFESAERLSADCSDFHFPEGSDRKNAIRLGFDLADIPCEAHSFISKYYDHEVIVYMGNREFWEVKRGKMHPKSTR